MDYPKSVPGVGLVNGHFVDENPATGQPGSLIPAQWGNAVTDELLTVIAAAGLAPAEANNAQLLQALRQIIQASNTGVVGTARRLRASVPVAAASATFTADEVIVESALGGAAYRVANLNKAINLATVGVGGMDTGTAPVSGYVAIYLIYNPATEASALLAVNATSAAAPEVYGGVNMPAGYTASALVSVWQTDASRNLIIGYQVGRRISRRPFTAIGGTGPTGGAVTAVSIAGAVPLNTTRVFGSYGMNNASSTNMSFHIYTGTVSQAADCFIAINGTNMNSTYDICNEFPQAIAYSNTGVGGTFFIYVNGYEF